MLASRLCQRAAASRPCILTHNPSCLLRTTPRSRVLWQAKRVFVSTPQHRKVDARIQVGQQDATEQKQVEQDATNPKDAKQVKPTATKNDPLLAEQTVSNKEQRKADWAIIRDMAHYLWPKDDVWTRFRVGLSVGLLVGAKVCHPLNLCASTYVDSICRSSMSKSHSISNRLSIV